MTTVPTQFTLVTMSNARNWLVKKLVLLIAMVVSMAACVEKQESDYSVNATIVPDEDGSRENKASRE